MTTTTLKQVFEDTLVLARVIDFDPTWNNGTGYFDKAVTVDIQAGDMAQATCPETNRRLLLVGTELGTIVVFERYNPVNSKDYVLTTNVPPAYRELLNGALTQETLGRIINGEIVKEALSNQEEETMSDKTETTTEKKNTGKVKGYAKKFGKGVLYGAGAVAVAGGAYALYAMLKGAGADAAAEAVGEAAGAVMTAAGEAVAETVAAWK